MIDGIDVLFIDFRMYSRASANTFGDKSRVCFERDINTQVWSVFTRNSAVTNKYGMFLVKFLSIIILQANLHSFKSLEF